MLDYLQKFRQLPENIRNKISNSETSEIISNLEEKYGVSLVATVMKVTTKDIPFNELESHLINDLGISRERVRSLSEELEKKIFSSVKDYLESEKSAEEYFSGSQQKSQKEESSSKEKKKIPQESEEEQKSLDQEEETSSSRKKELFLPKSKKRKKLEAGEEEEQEGQKADSEEVREKDSSTSSGRGKKKETSSRVSFLPKRKRTKKLPEGEEEKEEENESERKEEVKQALKKRESSSRSQEEQQEESDMSQDNVVTSEDEEELKQLSAKVKDLSDKKGEEKQSLQKKADKVLQESDINFSSEEVKERFKKIISTYLQGIRNKQKTRDALSKGFKKGGLDLDDATCDRVFSVADKYLQQTSVTAEEPGKEEKEKDFHQEESVSTSGKQDKEEPQKTEQKDLGEKRSPSEEKEAVQKSKDSSKIEAEEDKKEDKGTTLDQMPQRDVDYDLSSALKQIEEKEKSQDGGQESDETETSSSEKTSKKEEKEQEKEEKKDKEKAGKEEQERDTKPSASLKEEGSKEKQEKTLKKDSEERKQDRSLKEEKKKTKEKQDAEESKTSGQDKEAEKANKTKVKRSVLAAEEGGKKRMDDIKKSPKLINPVNELKYMDLATFRRLGNDAEERTAKIKQKVDSLGKKYFAEKLDGIKAWRKSPVYRMYIQIGTDSIVYNKPVDDIIEEKTQENGDYLNQKEFDAIMDLNNELRFY